MKHIVNFSGGDCSFWAAHMVVERYGAENTVLLFADVLIEDEDLYAFNAKAEQILGIKITRLCYGLTPWQLFRKEGLIANDRSPICSIRLKRELLDAHMMQNYEMNHNQQNAFAEHATVHIGFDWTEPHRLDAMRKAHPTWTVEAPMQWEPIWDKCKMRREAEKLGLPEQKLYKLGFPHNNCGGRCVRAGQAHWVHLLKTLPERFAEWENEEQETLSQFKERGIGGDKEWTMLTETKGKVKRSLSLRELRRRVEAGEQFDRNDWGGCGCGGAAK